MGPDPAPAAIAPPTKSPCKSTHFAVTPPTLTFSTTGSLPGGSWNWPIQRLIFTSTPPGFEEKVNLTGPCAVGNLESRVDELRRRILDLVPAGGDREPNPVKCLFEWTRLDDFRRRG